MVKDCQSQHEETRRIPLRCGCVDFRCFECGLGYRIQCSTCGGGYRRLMV